MEASVYTDRKGNEYTIEPLGSDKLLEVTRSLKKKGIVVSSEDKEFEKGLEFSFALAQAVCTGIRLKNADGNLITLSPAEKTNYILKTPGAAPWITGKAGQLAADLAKQFEEEQGNS